ncbi:MAG: S-layer homology domain-containing protein, partial [Actinomycetota bacterium]
SPPGDGTQMAAFWAGDRYYTLGGRTSSAYDPIPEDWQGVEVYEVTPCPESEANVLNCFLDDRFAMGFRETAPWGRHPFQPGTRPAHVIPAGSSSTVGGREVSVTAAGEGAFQVSIGQGTSFTDISGHVFAQDIQWLAASGITKGCNPPGNSLFCPDDPVTRGQMAAFLHRALPDLPAGSVTDFTDDDGSVFESDIEWLSATGVTRGCNPPANDRFCPDQIVTRSQMAAFLHRALPDLATGPSTDFTDDDGSVFESDIEWLAATGVTRGCNPPANDRFCPEDPVTRGAMAAFLHRAMGG